MDSCRCADGDNRTMWGAVVAGILEGRFPYTTGDVFNIDGGMQLRAF